MIDLQELEAIKQLKYRYVRHLDLKQWEELARCFVEDATVAYGDGKFSFTGRDAIMQFLRGALDEPTRITRHRCGHPEIEFTTPTTARGIWALSDVVIDLQSKTTLRGAAYYDDEYVKVDGEWKFRSTGYRRLFEEMESRTDTPSLMMIGTAFDKKE